MRLDMLAATLCAAVSLGSGARAAEPPLPPVAPESAGFSAERLQRIDDFFDREIKANPVGNRS